MRKLRFRVVNHQPKVISGKQFTFKPSSIWLWSLPCTIPQDPVAPCFDCSFRYLQETFIPVMEWGCRIEIPIPKNMTAHCPHHGPLFIRTLPRIWWVGIIIVIAPAMPEQSILLDNVEEARKARGTAAGEGKSLGCPSWWVSPSWTLLHHTGLLKHIHDAASGPLHWPFPLLGMLFPRWPWLVVSSFTCLC